MSIRSKVARTAAVAAGGLLLAATAVGSASAASVQEDPTFKAMREACGDGYLCVFSGPAGTGEMFKYYECTDAVAAPWQIKSWINNQYTGTVAGFWGPAPANSDGPWIEQYTSTAPEFDDDTRGFDTRAVDPC
ncbi:peptidase inhibitor family I36 protein [Saccharopolyspora griseoalba]|uniref:Peptidase inhibitor family I36 protein n=1 Tax=Saccharopolyspora griseoalba TaxID=1431848 RepID=A0ABW2LCH0_9PSEU